VNKILERIKKLLSLATSNNENEAQLASAKATELLTKHNLDMQQVEHANAEYIENTISEDKRVCNEDKYLSTILVNHFNVKVLKDLRGSTTKINIIGDKVNVEIAEYTYNFLKAQFRQLFRQYMKDTGATTKDRSSYYYGLFKGFNEQMNAAKKKVESEYGLVVVPDAGIAKFMKQQHPRTRSSKNSFNVGNAEAVNAGKDAGKALRVSRGMNSSTTSTKLLGV